MEQHAIEGVIAFDDVDLKSSFDLCRMIEARWSNSSRRVTESEGNKRHCDWMLHDGGQISARACWIPCRAAESMFSGKLLNASRVVAAESSNQQNAASLRTRAAKYAHARILSLRHLPGHRHERLAHEHDIGGRA